MKLFFYLSSLFLLISCSSTSPYQYKVEILNNKQSLLAKEYSNRAIVYKKEKKYAQAIALNQKSLAIHLKELPVNHEALSINYDTMGVLYHIIGKNDLAIKYFKKSLYLREQYFPKSQRFLADSYNNLAISFSAILNYKEALFYLKKSLAIRQNILGKTHTETASSYSAIGAIYEKMGSYAKSWHYHNKAIAVLEKKEPSLALASAYAAIVEVFLKQHDYQRAMRYSKRMIELYGTLSQKESLAMAGAYNTMGVVLMHFQKFDDSLAYFNRAIALKKRLLGETTEFLTQEYLNLGWLHYYAKKEKKAYMYVVKAFELLITQRDNYFTSLDPLENAHYLQNNKNHLYLLLQLTHELGDKKTFKKSFTLWLHYKGSIFKNQNRMLALSLKTKSLATKKKIELLKKEQRSLAKLYYSQHSSKKEVIKLKQKVSKLREELFFNTQGSSINFKSLVNVLKPNELYVDFAHVRQHYFGFALNSKGEIFFVRKNLKSSQKISKLIVNFRTKVAKDNGQTKEELSQLYTLLLKTLVEVLAKEKNTLLLSMDGLLNLFPFETLYLEKEKKYLIEKKKIQYIPSGRELIRLRTLTQACQNSKIVLFSNPNFDTVASESLLRGANKRVFSMRFSTLKGTKQESDLIQQIMKKSKQEVYEGENATEENLFQVKKPKILHIATHGFFIKSELENPMLNAGIALSGANESLKKGRDYGIVTAMKLSGLNLKGTELVVLSACETGLISLKSTESVSVLSKAFIQAGAKRVVASLWSVSDQGTKEFMGNFYENIAKNHTYSEALREAKIKMIKEGISFGVWSSFILNGL